MNILAAVPMLARKGFVANYGDRFSAPVSHGKRRLPFFLGVGKEH